MNRVERDDKAAVDLQEGYRRAEFSQTARYLDELLESAPNAEAVLLRARVALRSRKPSEALVVLASHAAQLGAPDDRAKAALISGSAFARLGDREAAEAQFTSAAAESVNNSSLRLALLYERAAAAWIARDLHEAESRLDEFSALNPPLGELFLEAQVLRGMIAASRGNLAEQGAIMLEALARLHTLEKPPVIHWAVVASQIAYLAREMPSRALRDAATAELVRLPWTIDLSEYRFTMTRAIGWRHALDGDYFNAFRRLKEAQAHAPSDAWLVMALCDRAYLASVLGERHWSEQELRDAHELAASISWSALDREERFALCVLAELFAPRDSALALSYFARYRALGNHFDRTLASSEDRRVEAMEAFSFGVVKDALGEKGEAIRLLRRAWTIYDGIGYDWRAGRVAKLLAEITADDAWKARSALKLRDYENSWLCTADISVAGLPQKAHSLTPARRAVYELLLQGLTTAQIATEQGRSEFTVRNHVKAIFKAFGVKSRPALLAQAARQQTLE
jgi:DNA-binding CsgD family transcriptional regulator